MLGNVKLDVKIGDYIRLLNFEWYSKNKVQVGNG